MQNSLYTRLLALTQEFQAFGKTFDFSDNQFNVPLSNTYIRHKRAIYHAMKPLVEIHMMQKHSIDLKKIPANRQMGEYLDDSTGDYVQVIIQDYQAPFPANYKIPAQTIMNMAYKMSVWTK